MKNKLSIIICLIVVSNQLWSADFSTVNKGKMLYYNIIKNTQNIEVTKSDISSKGISTSLVELHYTEMNNGEVVNNKKYRGSIIIPSSVEFEGEVYTVTGIGERAFQNCKNLTSISIPNSITAIGNGAFDGCENLKAVKIPTSVKTIGYYAFQRSGIISISIPNGIQQIERFAFNGCPLLSTIIIPSSVTSIAESAFAANNTTSIIIPNSVTNIDKNVFNNCINLKIITIPESVNSIGEGTFDICRNLEQISLQSSEPIKLSDKFFENVMSSSLSLKVPKGSIENYKKADGWRHITSISEF